MILSCPKPPSPPSLAKLHLLRPLFVFTKDRKKTLWLVQSSKLNTEKIYI